MTNEERLVADFESTGLSLGPHQMAYQRHMMDSLGVVPAAVLKSKQNGIYTSIAGAVIRRQRPGSAEAFIFLSMEDETSISSAIINPQLYERNRIAVTRGKFLQIDGTRQNQDGVINIRASAVHMLSMTDVDRRSRDFHCSQMASLVRDFLPQTDVRSGEQNT